MLALLLLSRGEVVPADRLAESLWGEAPPANAPGALQSYVSHLRRRLEPGAAARSRSGIIASEGTGYVVRLPPDAVDAWRFEAMLKQAAGEDVSLLEQALELWRGPALCDYADEPWAQPEVTRLHDLREVAREQLLGARLAAGEAALLVPQLEALVAEQPLREERWRLLVLGLYRAQRQADALGALRRARATLAEELGVDPGPALRELEAEVLAQSPALEVPRQRQPFSVPASLSGADPHDLVDREREVAVLRRSLEEVVAGEPRFVVVEGPAGIGKSRLLAELRRLAGERACRVLSARGSQLEKSFGFGAVRQLFEPELVGPRREQLLGGAAAPARGVFDLLDGAQAEGSFAILHGLYWLTVALAEDRPLVLVLDDLQWCDVGSLRYLAYLVPRLEGTPLLVVGTIRTGERHADEELLAELALDPATVVVRPEPLSPEGTAVMVRARLGEHAAPSFVSVCHRTTSGNPLLLRQLLRALEADRVPPDAAHADRVLAVGSRAVSSMVLMRMRRLPAEATRVARAVAVLGEGAQLPAVAALAELPEQATAAALAALSRTEIVRDELPLGFVHALVRDAVHRDIPPGERELWHERAAVVLRGTGGGAEQVAAQLLLAPRRGDADAVELLRTAARTAADRGASEGAVTYLRRALDEPPPDDVRAAVLVELGTLEALLDGPASAAHLTEAYPLIADARARGELASAIARTHVFASPSGTAADFARRAAADLPPELDDLRQQLVALERISGFIQGLDPALWRTQPPPEPSGTGHGAQMLSATIAWETLLDGVDRERCLALARASVEGDRLWAVDNGLFWIVGANCRLLAGEELGDFWARARAHAHARGSLFAALSVNLWAGYWHWHRGELFDAVDCLRACEEQNRMWRTFVGSAFSRAFLIGVLVDRGDLVAARGLADEVPYGEIPGDGGRLLLLSVVRLLLAEGRPAEALAALDGVPAADIVVNPVWNQRRSVRAQVLQALGRTEEATALVEQEVELLRRWGAPAYLGPAVRLLGELTGSASLLREAVALLTPTEAAVERARAQCALATRPEVPDAEAIPLLQAALATAQQCGADPVRDATIAQLGRRGSVVDPSRFERSAPSVTQRRVRELVDAGLEVHEIAQALFLTPGTVRSALEQVGAEGR